MEGKLTHFEIDLNGNQGKAEIFDFRKDKALIHGIYRKQEDKVYIWLITSSEEYRGKTLVDMVVKEFNCPHLTFTPLVNCNVECAFKGDKKIMKPDDPLNPYGESFEYMNVEWEYAKTEGEKL